MANALALFAISRGLQANQQIKDAYQQQVVARLSAESIQRQMDEINDRTNIEIANINKQRDRTLSEQQASYIYSGASMTGSAMSVLSDTISQAAEATYIARRETDYELQNLAAKKAGFDYAARNRELLDNLLAIGLNTGAGYVSDVHSYNRANTRTRGASGLGGN